MMNTKTNKLIPELRFPEFLNDGEWEEKKLGDFGRFFRGLTYGADDTSSKGLLVLRSGNIQNDTLVLDKDLVYVDKKCPDELKLLNGDIVICMSNGSKALVGKNAEYKGEYDGKITVGAFCSIMRPKNKFTKYFLQSDAYQSFIALSIGGGNINNLKNSDLEEFECYAPTKPTEQQKIADCLSSLDEVITAHNDKLETLKTYKKGLMQNLFPAPPPKEGAGGRLVPKIRFKEFEKDEEWVENELNEFCFNISSGKDKNSEDGTFALYGSTGIIGKSENASYNGDYILVARVGANAGMLNRANGKFGVTDNTLVLNLKENAIIDFIYYSLNKIGLNKLVFGSGQPLITGGQLKILKIFNPKKSAEQQKIAETLSSLDELIKEQSSTIEQLKSHKKGLMQGMFPRIQN